jgi:hypothetical protein
MTSSGIANGLRVFVSLYIEGGCTHERLSVEGRMACLQKRDGMCDREKQEKHREDEQ